MGPEARSNHGFLAVMIDLAVAGERVGAPWLQPDAVPCRAPHNPWLPAATRRRRDRDQLSILSDRQGMSGRRRAEHELATSPSAIAAHRLGCSLHARDEHGVAISVGGDEATTMVCLERAETATTQPTRLVLPDGIGGQHRRRAGEACDLGIGGAEFCIAADQRVGRVLRARAFCLHLLKRRRNGRRLSHRWVDAGHEQWQQA